MAETWQAGLWGLLMLLLTPSGLSHEQRDQATGVYERGSGANPRERAELQLWCDRLALDLVEPGLVPLSAWRPRQLRPQRTRPYGAATQEESSLGALAAVGAIRQSGGPTQGRI